MDLDDRVGLFASPLRTGVDQSSPAIITRSPGDPLSAIVEAYLDLLDAQRESAFAALDGITDAQLWQRPAPGEWSIGEILDHNYLLIASMYPAVNWMWKLNGWYGRLRRKRPYKTEIEDVYRDPKFPQWVGFLWTPRYNMRKPVSIDVLSNELRELHAKVRRFYRGKD